LLICVPAIIAQELQPLVLNAEQQIGIAILIEVSGGY